MVEIESTIKQVLKDIDRIESGIEYEFNGIFDEEFLTKTSVKESMIDRKIHLLEMLLKYNSEERKNK